MIRNPKLGSEVKVEVEQICILHCNRSIVYAHIVIKSTI